MATGFVKRMFSRKKKENQYEYVNNPNYLKFTAQPTKAWEVAKQSQLFNDVTLPSENQDKADGNVRVVCISDTHGLTNQGGPLSKVPNGDILIHAGDFSWFGKMKEVVAFNEYLATLNHPVKIVIAGNHDIGFHESTSKRLHRNCFVPAAEMKAMLKDCIYLEDESIEVMGLKIYGSPWTPLSNDWAFRKQRGEEINKVWEEIPNDTDILVTHGPPLGRGDKCSLGGTRAGCANLLHIVQNHVKPRYHIFGHIHEGYGWSSDGVTTFINASSCNIRYQPVNNPVVFDIAV